MRLLPLLSAKKNESMKHPFLILLFTFLNSASQAGTPNLLGVVTRDSLMAEPYLSWYQPNYDSYSPDSAVIAKLKKLKLGTITVDIFFGTWCGDSKREVPRFLKIADEIQLDSKNIRMIAVSSGEQYKQSPGGETRGKGIYRVATFVFYRNGKEINRINEYPTFTLEHDLLAILSDTRYTPNFPAFSIIDEWLESGTLTHPNMSVRGLSNDLKPLVNSPSELNAVGYVLMAQGKLQEARKIFAMNVQLFYDDTNAYLSLAECQTKLGLHENALYNLDCAFKINEGDSFLKLMLDQYYDARKAMEK